MTSAQEGLIFGALDLNAASDGWTMQAFNPGTPSKRLQRLSSPDADADILAEAAKHDVRTATAKLQWEGGDDMDDALDAIQTLVALLQQCEEIEEGMPLVWTPATSTHSGTLYVQSGEITEMPIEQDGDGAGWLLTTPKPIVTVRFDCFPFIEGEEYLAGSFASTTDRIASMEVEDVPGDVPALARLVVTEEDSDDRAYVEIGGDRYGYDPGDPSDLDLTAASDLTALAGTLSGSYIGLTASTSPIGICEAQGLDHTGPHVARALVERTATGTTIRVRSAMRTVDGQWTYTPWKTLPTPIGTYEVRLGEVTFPVVKRGTQASTLRVEVRASASSVVRVYRINLIPTEVVYAMARQRTGGGPASFDLFDVFEQSAGNLDAPKTANIGGNWSEVNRTDADGFQVETTGKTAQRTTIEDASLNGGGCYAMVGSAVAATQVQATVKFSTSRIGFSEVARFGLLARYVDANNWAALTLVPMQYPADSLLYLWKKVGGTVSGIGFSESIYFGAASFSHLLRLEIDADGTFRCYWQGTLLVSGNDPVFATGGTLASGKRGLYDAYTSATANTRNYDDFQAPAAPPVNHPLFADRSCEFSSRGMLREADAGSDWAPFVARGRNLFIPPAGPDGLTTRLVVKDGTADIDGGVADGSRPARSAELYVTPRFLVVP